MSGYSAKNYTEQSGDVTHIGGKLIIEEGASVEGLPEPEGYVLPAASGSRLGGVKVGEGLAISNGVLSLDEDEGGEEYVLPVATRDSLGGVRLGYDIDQSEDGTLSIERLRINPPRATDERLGIVRPRYGLKIAEEGVLEFAGYENKCVCVSGNMEDDNIEVIFPDMVSRYHISCHFEASKKDDVYVIYKDDDENILFRAIIRSVANRDDHRTYFQAYRSIGNRTLREYIIGISAWDNQIEDVLFTRDITF